MNDLAQYLLAQAAKQPVATLKFASGELWRRGRLRWTNSIEKGLPSLSAADLQGRFAPFLSPAAFAREDLERNFPGATELALQAADLICKHEFEILGSHYSAGPTIQWSRDCVSGYEWPCALPAEINVLSATNGSDVKRPWELARFHHALALGKAFALSGNEAYAREFVQQLQQWISENPYPRGIHWAMPMEVSIRAINLAVAGAFFTGAASLDAQFWARFLDALFLHGRYLNLHREWNPIARGNHYLGCVVGLLFLGVLFRREDDGRDWLAQAQSAILTEMSWAVGNDGVAHEGSSGYHAVVTEMMLAAAIVGTRATNDSSLQPTTPTNIEKTWGKPFRDKLERMLDFPSAMENGRQHPPILGDSDDARLLPLCGHSDAGGSEYLLAMGRNLFSRADWAGANHSCEQAWWILGPSRSAAKRKQPRASSFPDAGFYFLASDRIRASVRCGPLGVRGWANHAHCDQLNVEFCLDGEPVLVDPGTYLYSGDAQARNHFRGSRSHNAPIVAGEEQNRFWENLLFRIVDDTKSETLRWEETETSISFCGQHHGYERLPGKVTVRREVTLNRTSHSLLIVDTLSGSQREEIEWFWQFAPGIDPVLILNSVPASLPQYAALAFHSAWRTGLMELRVWTSAEAKGIRGKVCDGWVAPRYGERIAARGLHFACAASLALQAVFLFTPSKRLTEESS